MRSSSIVALGLLSFTACTDSGEPAVEEDTLAFEIQSAPFELAPGEETTKCFYFTTNNTDTVAVHKWVSDMSPGSHHMIMFRTFTGTQPPDGTIDEVCGGDGINVPVYGTQIAHEELVFPEDDGNGRPIGQNIEANSKGFFQMHYFNSSDQPISTQVSIKAYSLPAKVVDDLAYTRTDIFATYNRDIEIPPGATNFKVSATCGGVEGKFFQMSTHAHKQAISTRIAEADQTVFTSNSWEHPGSAAFSAPQFYEFASGSITWECTYNNTGDNAGRTIVDGLSAKTNEMCMATGYFFPAITPHGCIFSRGECECLP
jgi:hypothetical protein